MEIKYNFSPINIVARVVKYILFTLIFFLFFESHSFFQQKFIFFIKTNVVAISHQSYVNNISHRRQIHHTRICYASPRKID